MADSIPSTASAITVAAASPSGASVRRSLPFLRSCVLVLLAAGTFVFHVSLERRLDGLGAFDQWDVIFDTDPNLRLHAFASGGWRQRCVIHPLLRVVSLPVRGAAILADHAGITVAPPGGARRVVAMFVAPLCSALTAVVMFRVFLGAGFGDPAALAGTILHQVAFSQMIFGSIPDHFVMGGLGLSLVLLCGLVLPTADRIGWPRWLAVGVFTAGVTISQIIPTCLMFAACCRFGGLGLRQTARATALLGGSSVALVLSLSWLLTFPDPRSTPLSPVAQVAQYTEFFPARPLDHAFDAIAALPNSIAPPPARVVPGHAGETDRYHIRFTLELVRDPVRVAAVWIPFVVGAWLGFRSDMPRRRALWLGSISIVLYNLLFHALWGNEWFLYSQHWLAPMVFVMATPLCDPGRFRGPVWLAVAIALPLIVAGNWQRCGEIVARLEAEPKVVAAPSGASR